MNFVEELRWRGMLQDIMPGTAGTHRWRYRYDWRPFRKIGRT